VSDDELLNELEHRRDEIVDDLVVVVECTSASQLDPSVMRSRLSGLPAMFIAVGFGATSPVAEAMDVVAADDAEIDRFGDIVTRHRAAAISLAMLLRDGDHRSVSEGLLAESVTYSMLQTGSDHRRWLEGRPAREPRAADPDDEVVRLQRSGDHLRITLNRPHTRNAFNAAMRDALLEALAVVAADRSLTATIDAVGRAFCSGGDLREFGTAEDSSAAHLLRVRRNVGGALDDVADRVTVEVHGTCVGAGVELPSFAHCVVAAPDATFCLPELGMGLIPGAGGTVSIPRRIGRQRTLAMALGGDSIDAEVALDWGLIDEVAQPPEPLA
jgi:enoyl-CoA hydratase/carnithine racemase